MRAVDLPSPGNLSMGIKLRTETAKAISSVEVTASKTAGGKIDTAGKLAAFFRYAADSLSGLYETTAPGVSSRVIEDDEPTLIVVTFDEAMNQSVVPAVSDFTLAGAGLGTKEIESVDYISSTELVLTLNEAAANGDVLTLAYTKPTLNYLQDKSGNAVATFAAAAITNNVAA